MALITAGSALVVALGFAARGMIPPTKIDRYLAILAGIAIVCPMTLGMCIYYLFSSPAQNARFIKWAEQHRWGKPPANFDWTLLNAADPDYDVPTIKYMLNRRRPSGPR
jgi:hypothetical protein